MWERLKWPRVEYWCKNRWEKMFIKHTRVDIRTVPKSPDMIIQVINNCNVKTWGASDLFKLIEKWGKKFKIYARQWKEMIKKVGRLELVVSKSKKLRSKHYSESFWWWKPRGCQVWRLDWPWLVSPLNTFSEVILITPKLKKRFIFMFVGIPKDGIHCPVGVSGWEQPSSSARAGSALDHWLISAGPLLLISPSLKQ